MSVWCVQVFRCGLFTVNPSPKCQCDVCKCSAVACLQLTHLQSGSVMCASVQLLLVYSELWCGLIEPLQLTECLTCVKSQLSVFVLSDMCKVTAKCVVCCAPDPLSDMCKVTAKCIVRCVPDPLDQEVSCITEAEEDLQSSSSFCRADDATSACAAKELKTADSVIQFMKKVWWFCGGFECVWGGGLLLF